MKYQIKFPENYTKSVLPGKTEWVSALRSGQYKQGQHKLCIDGAYCCLGVLCVVQNRPSRINTGTNTTVILFDNDACALGDANPLTKIFSKCGNFPDGISVISDEILDELRDTMTGEFSNLMGLNDAGFSFLEIADIIDAIWD